MGHAGQSSDLPIRVQETAHPLIHGTLRGRSRETDVSFRYAGKETFGPRYSRPMPVRALLVVGVCLFLACADRTTGGDDGAGTSADDGSADTGSDTATADGASGNASGVDAGDATGSAACTGFAAGSLSNTIAVPAIVPTALGVTLDFRSVDGNALDVVFTCTSNGEVLYDAPVASGSANPNVAFDVETVDGEWNVALSWVPSTDIDFSVAITRYPRRMPRSGCGIFAGLFVFGAASVSHAAEDELVVRPLSMTDANYGHLEYVPPGYATSGHKHPVMVFLHGAGESGDGETNLFGPMTVHGPGKLVEQGNTFFADQDMLLFIPQSPGWWDANEVHAFLGYIAANFRVDPRRVYLTGLSMGGGGTWSYVESHPGRVSSAVPICGAAGPGNGVSFVDTPVWAFHSWGDPTVTRTNSIGWVDNIADAILGADVPDVLTTYPHENGDTNLPALMDMTAVYDAGDFSWSDGVNAAGPSTLRLTLYTDNAHDSWTRTYDEPAVLDWLVSHDKPAALDDDTYIVDNLDEGATFEGDWTRSQSVEGYYWWDVHEAASSADAVATFTADLPAGVYEVYVSWTADDDRSTAVEVTIAGSDESPEASTLDMTQGGGFTSLGELTFSGGTGSVSLRGTDGVDGLVIADAVGFVPIAPDPGGDTGGDTSSGGGNVDGSGGDVTGASDAGDGPDDVGGEGSSGSGTGSAGGATDGEGGGCDCRTTSNAPRWGVGALLVLALFGGRRRANSGDERSM